MAKIKTTAMVSEIRNSVAGTTFSVNGYGAYIRTKVTPTNPQTSYQQAQRQLLGALSSGWRSLTQAQRDAWNSAVGNFKQTDVFGDAQTLTGQTLYIMLNTNLSNAGEEVLDNPPSPQAIPAIAIAAVSAVVTGHVLTLTIDPVAIPAEHKLFVYATAPVSAGKSYLKNEMRLIVAGATATAGVVTLTEDYANRFGEFAAGLKIGVGILLVNSISGEAGVIVYDDVIAA